MRLSMKLAVLRSLRRSLSGDQGRSTRISRRQLSSTQTSRCQTSSNNNREWPMKDTRVLLLNERNVDTSRTQGCLFNAVYLDTAAKLNRAEKRKMPSVMFLHGTPGSHENFLPLIGPLVEEGFRVIAINTPGYGWTKGETEEDNKFFGHMVEDRFEFIMNALSNIEVERLDVVVGHSSGCLPLTCLLTCSSIVKSAVYICSSPGHKSGQVYRYFLPLMRLMYNAWDSQLLRPITRAIFAPIYSRFAFPNIPVDHAINHIKSFTFVNHHMMKSLASEICLTNIPIVNMYSCDDPVVTRTESEEWGQMLGVKPGSTDVYDAQGKLITQGGSPGQYSREVLLQGGGHMPMRNKMMVPAIVREIIKIYEVSKDR